ncbi:MAG: hypothetical protein ACKVP3_06230 [Hyphomicrobiaceae bacterium]
MRIIAETTHHLAAFLVLALVATGASAQSPSPKPKIPPGTDPGGIAIALIAYGIDYTDPEIAPRLARDGEGDIIGWDFVTGDNKPFAAAPDSGIDGTHLAKLILSAYARGRLVPLRVAPADPAQFAQAMRFVLQSPARIIAVPLWNARPEITEVMNAAAAHARDRLFIIPAGEGVTAQRSGNLLSAAALATAEISTPAFLAVVDVWVRPRGAAMFGSRPGSPPADALEAHALAAAFAACAQHGGPPLDGAAARSAVLTRTQPQTFKDAVLPVLDPQCLYGGQRF